MEAGNNGLTKTKYLTFGIKAESMKTAKPRLTHIETDILNNFKRLGVRATTLNGCERLELMHRQLHMGDDAKFHFDWKYLVGSGLSVKDFIAPSSFAFPTGRYFQVGDLYGCMSFLSIDASDISDRLLADFLSMESSQIVTMHIQSVDQNEAIKTIKHDDIIISDPESEYSPLVARFGGQVIKISPASDQYINPMDINMNYSDDDNPIALKTDFILSLCELIMGNKDGLKPVEKTVIDRCIRQIYQKYFENPGSENMPILGDLYQALLSQDESEAKHVATALEIYVSGSLNVFNHRTNVELTNRRMRRLRF